MNNDSEDRKSTLFQANLRIVNEHAAKLAILLQKNLDSSLSKSEQRKQLIGLLQKSEIFLSMTLFEQALCMESVLDELTGFGPLGNLVRDSTIAVIEVFEIDHVVVTKEGKLHDTDTAFESREHLRKIIERHISKKLSEICAQTSWNLEGNLTLIVSWTNRKKGSPLITIKKGSDFEGAMILSKSPKKDGPDESEEKSQHLNVD